MLPRPCRRESNGPGVRARASERARAWGVGGRVGEGRASLAAAVSSFAAPAAIPLSPPPATFPGARVRARRAGGSSWRSRPRPARTEPELPAGGRGGEERGGGGGTPPVGGGRSAPLRLSAPPTSARGRACAVLGQGGAARGGLGPIAAAPPQPGVGVLLGAGRAPRPRRSLVLAGRQARRRGLGLATAGTREVPGRGPLEAKQLSLGLFLTSERVEGGCA